MWFRVPRRRWWIAAVTLGLTLVLSGCEPEPTSGKGFRLPDGNAEAGRVAFLALHCHECHGVFGVELPAPEATAPAWVILGGPVRRVHTYGELVTSIIHPSHTLARGYPKEDISEGGESAMPNFNRAMTVQQLIDLVAFLQIHYEVTPPEPDPYLP